MGLNSLRPTTDHLPPTACDRSGRVRRLPVAEGPVFLWHFEEVDHHVLRPHPRVAAQVFGDPRVERPFLLERAPGVQGDLYEEESLASSNPEVGGVVDELARAVLG